MDGGHKWQRRKEREEIVAARDTTYRVVRYRIGARRQVLAWGLNLQQAQMQCNAKGSRGPGWWDGYEIDD